MKVLITGANGFLGSWLTKRLLEEGYEVDALVRKNSDLSELHPIKPNLVYGDVTDYASLREAFDKKDIVFHLAGAVGYKKSLRPLMEKVNVVGTENVVNACAKLEIPQLLHLSSVVTIGANTQPIVMNEDFAYNISELNLGYFETKRKAEQIVLAATLQKKIRAICVNPSTIYGFGDAKKESRKNQVKVANGKMPFYTSGGVNVVPVEDVINGIMLALKKGTNGERYILSSDNITIKELFTKIAYFAGVKPPSIQLPNFAMHALGTLDDALSYVGKSVGISSENAYTTTMYHWFDCTKAKTHLGFQPTSADAALEKSVRWMKDNKYIV